MFTEELTHLFQKGPQNTFIFILNFFQCFTSLQCKFKTYKKVCDKIYLAFQKSWSREWYYIVKRNENDNSCLILLPVNSPSSFTNDQRSLRVPGAGDVLVLNFKAIFWLERRISVNSFGQKLRSNSAVAELQKIQWRDRSQHLPLRQAALLASLTDTPYFINLNKLQLAIIPALSTLLPFLLNKLFQLLVLHRFHLHPLE